MRDVLDLCGLWRFQPDPSGEGEAVGYFQPDFDVVRWREVKVPVGFETCHPALEAYEGAGWFRRTFAVPEAWRDKRVVVSFEGVNYHVKVWVNGQVVGQHDDGFLPFALPLDDGLDINGENVIVVRVDNVRRQGEVPGMQRGWRTFGGILREAALVATDRLYIEHVVAVAEPAGGKKQEAGSKKQETGTVALRVEVKNQRASGDEVDVRARLLDGDAVLAEFSAQSQPLDARANAEFTMADRVAGVRPWSPSDPALYELVVDVCVDGQPVDSLSLRIGFRTVEAREGTLWFNGEPLYLTGFNRHEDSFARNMCTDLDTARRDLEAMKEAGANFVRLCHYPHHPGELDLCDELGLLAMGEIPLYWWDGLNEGEENCTRKLEAAQRQLQTMIRRDANHPSVIFWSVSNETEDWRPEVAEGNRELVRLAKALDPTRLAVHVSDHWQQHPNFDADDVICVNGYPSIHGRDQLANPDYDFAASTAFWRDGMAKLHAQYPEKPILVTEFGYASFHEVTSGAFGEDTHADVIAHEFAGMDAPYVCGATIWCWADHPWPAATFAFCRYLATSPYGVLTRDRRRRKPFWTARCLFREKQGMPDTPKSQPLHWGAAGYEVTMIRPHLCDIPQVPFPEGLGIRAMRLDEGGLWTDIERDAEPHFPVGEALFYSQFGQDMQALQWRSFIVTNEKGVGVGVISAWYHRTFKDQDYGMVHWVAVRPAYQGRGLGKAMLSFTLNQLSQWHERAFLGTQTKRLSAIKLYLDFGFVPDLDQSGVMDAWRDVNAQLHHPALDALLQGV